MKHLFKIGFCIVISTVFAHAGKKPAINADSLNTLKNLLSSELKAGGDVIRLKDPQMSETLFQVPISMRAFGRLIRDTSLVREVGGAGEFQNYWKKVEKENGYPALQGQLSSHDIDRTLIPKAYLFDSSVVVYPGWIILRRMKN